MENIDGSPKELHLVDGVNIKRNLKILMICIYINCTNLSILEQFYVY